VTKAACTTGWPTVGTTSAVAPALRRSLAASSAHRRTSGALSGSELTLGTLTRRERSSSYCRLRSLRVALIRLNWGMDSFIFLNQPEVSPGVLISLPGCLPWQDRPNYCIVAPCDDRCTIEGGESVEGGEPYPGGREEPVDAGEEVGENEVFVLEGH
jgi:hypothetical protein